MSRGMSTGSPFRRAQAEYIKQRRLRILEICNRPHTRYQILLVLGSIAGGDTINGWVRTDTRALTAAGYLRSSNDGYHGGYTITEKGKRYLAEQTQPETEKGFPEAAK